MGVGRPLVFPVPCSPSRAAYPLGYLGCSFVCVCGYCFLSGVIVYGCSLLPCVGVDLPVWSCLCVCVLWYVYLSSASWGDAVECCTGVTVPSLSSEEGEGCWRIRGRGTGFVEWSLSVYRVLSCPGLGCCLCRAIPMRSCFRRDCGEAHPVWCCMGLESCVLSD